MRHHHFNIINRREFLTTAGKAGMLAALASISNVPFVLKQALADGSIGSGKKVLFIWMRFGNDSLNSLIPVNDPSYVTSRPKIGIPLDSGTSYTTAGACLFPQAGAGSTYGTFPFAIPTGNGFAALHPSLKFLAPVYNAGDLALIHRVAYPKQSRSHFDSQIYWENGTPNNGLVKDGIFYRTLIESGLNNLGARGVSIQNSLPLLLRGSAAAMTNLTDPQRYELLGIPATNGVTKATASIATGNTYGFAPKLNRDMLHNQYENLQATLNAFGAIDFTEAGNTFQDDEKTDNDTGWVPPVRAGEPAGDAAKGYYLFPTTNDKNGGWRRSASITDANKYAVDPTHQGFFYNLKAAALVLNKTDAVIAGTEIGGFDTHQLQVQNNNGTPVPTQGNHANLQRAVGWALYGVRKYFMNHAQNVTWNNLVVVTLSEFGRTTIENSDLGTDHAEAGLMFVAGGAVKGFNKGNPSGIFNCNPNEAIAANLKWTIGPSGSMFAASSRYLGRNTDFRSVLGEVIRKHLGASQTQLNRIIPGYVNEPELLSGGNSSEGGGKFVPIRGEIGIL